jgi:hypothetical protein
MTNYLQAKYTIVENAGYEGENERMAGFNSAEAAWKYAERIYRKREIEELHVQVRQDFEDGEQTYEY